MTTIHELDLTPAFETENERRLRLLSEATEHMLFFESTKLYIREDIK